MPINQGGLLVRQAQAIINSSLFISEGEWKSVII
jgi:hypothetical protein